MSVDLRSNLYAVYHLNEELGNTVYDSSGNGRNGILVNMEDAHRIIGKLNNGLAFPGVNEYVNCGDIANFEKNSPFSIEFWVKFSSVNDRYMVSKQTAAFKGWGVRGYSGLIWATMYSNSTDRFYTQTSGSYNDNLWHHIVVTYDGSNNKSGLKIYVDSSIDSQSFGVTSISGSIINVANCQISGRGGINNLFAGNADEVIIYDKELNQEEVNFRWNNGYGTEDFLEGPEPVTVTFTVKDALGNHLNNINIKINQEDYINVNSPFDLDITEHTDIMFDKGGYETQIKCVEAVEHIENIVLEYLVKPSSCIYYR